MNEESNCSMRRVLDRIADKWTALVITVLDEGPLGYADLRRAASGISDKMLAQTLHQLGRAGLVDRTVHMTRPVRVTYALTPLGCTIVGPLAALRTWAQEYGDQVVAHQADYDNAS